MVTDKKVMAFTDFKRILDSTKAKRLTLVGTGENFINPDIIDILNYAGEKCYWFSITTNFTLVEGIIEDIINSKLGVLKISIDGATKETYNKIRKGAQYETILDNIVTLVQTKRKLHSDRPHIRFNFVIQHDNYSEIDQIVELAHDLGVPNVVFMMVRTSSKRLLDIPRGELMVKMKETSALAKKYDICSNLESIFADLQSFQWNNYVDYWKINKCSGYKKFHGCVYPWLSAHIDVEGNVSPCCSYRIFSKDDNYGNALESEWEDIWNCEKYQFIRFKIKKRLGISPSCMHCNGFGLKSLTKIDRVLPHFT
jgi:MoaA/NifB/PqqE/SkfB family radical SAM enzyme